MNTGYKKKRHPSSQIYHHSKAMFQKLSVYLYISMIFIPYSTAESVMHIIAFIYLS